MTPRSKAPTRSFEKELLGRGHALVAGMDEVGRGALAGPVSVGVVVVDAATGRVPAGLRDSKLLAPAARVRLREPILRWCVAGAVGHADADEVDRYGIIAALRLAGNRAFAALAGAAVVPDVVILDGNHDWLTRRPEQPEVPVAGPGLPVHVRIKGDMTIAAIAAASVLAKTERDAMMRALHEEHPEYGWAGNKGYSAPEHTAALRAHGATERHRRTWSLPTGPVVEQPSLGDLF